MKELTKDERIKIEKDKLLGLLKNLDENVLASIQGLIENAAFMRIALADLQEAIKEKGYVSTYQNSATQWGTKKSPEVELYLNMVKSYSTVIRQLGGYVNGSDLEEFDEFHEFVISRDV